MTMLPEGLEWYHVAGFIAFWAWFFWSKRNRRLSEHTCDRKGPPEKVIDESGDEPITRVYPTCSECGKPQVLSERA